MMLCLSYQKQVRFLRTSRANLLRKSKEQSHAGFLRCSKVVHCLESRVLLLFSLIIFLRFGFSNAAASVYHPLLISRPKQASPADQNLALAAEETCDGVDDITHDDIEEALGLEYEAALDEGGATIVATVEQWRNTSSILENLHAFFSDVSGVDRNDTDGEEVNKNSIGLSAEGMDYVESLLPYLTPAFLGVLLVLTTLPLLILAMCSSKCRRRCSCGCCLVACCGARRNSPSVFSSCNRIFGSLGGLVLGLALTAAVFLGIFWTDKLNSGLNKSQCALTALIRDVVNGVPSHSTPVVKGFIGFSPALETMATVSDSLNPDSGRGVILHVESLVQQALDVEPYKEALMESLSQMLNVLELVDKNLKGTNSAHHMFVFNTIISKLLMLSTFYESLQNNINSTLKDIRERADDYISIAKTELKDAYEQVHLMDFGSIKEDVDDGVSMYLKINNGVEESKEARYWVLMSLYILILLVAATASIYFVYLYCCSTPTRSSPSAASSAFGAYQQNRHPSSPRPTSYSWPSSKPSACCCATNFLCCIVAFVLGGVLLTVSIVQTDMCLYSKEEILTEAGLQGVMEGFGISNEKAVKAAKACLVKGANADLGDALELNASFEQIPKIRSYLGDIQSKIPLPFNVSFVDELVFSTRDLGWVFLIDVAETEASGHGDRLDTYNEVLRSGVQDKGRFLTGTYADGLQDVLSVGTDGGSDPIYGLLDIEEKIKPFYFEALHRGGTVDDPQGNFMITSDFDPESELVMIEARKKSTSDEADRRYLNAVWWAAAKQRLRSASSGFFTCPDSKQSVGVSPPVESGCDYNEFTDYLTESLAGNVQTSSKDFALAIEDGKYELVKYVNNTAESLLSDVENIRDNLSCAPIASGTQKLMSIWCEDVTQHALLTSLVWVLIGILTFMGFITMYLIWLVIQHNREMDRQAQVVAAQVDMTDVTPVCYA